MNDLFELRTSWSENSDKVRESSGLLLGSPKGKGNSGSTGLSLPPSQEKSGGVPFPLHQGSRGKSSGDLRAHAIRLMNEIEIAEDISAKLHAIQEPLADAFRAATGTLETIWLTRKSGGQVSRKVTLAAYDARVTAGHNWNPHRVRYQETLRWLKTLRMELKDVNREIGT